MTRRPKWNRGAVLAVAFVLSAVTTALCLWWTGVNSGRVGQTPPLASYGVIPVVDGLPKSVEAARFLVGSTPPVREAATGTRLQVVNAIGSPIENAMVRMVRESTRLVTGDQILFGGITDHSGEIAIDVALVKAGAYLHCAAYGYATRAIRILVEGDLPSVVVLEAEACVQISVRDKAGKPVKGCGFALSKTGPGGIDYLSRDYVTSGCPDVLATYVCISSDEGLVTFGGLSPGKYHICPDGADFLLVGPETVEARLGLQASVSYEALEVLGVLVSTKHDEDMIRAYLSLPNNLSPCPPGSYPHAMGLCRRNIAKRLDIPLQDVLLVAHVNRTVTPINGELRFYSARHGEQRAQIKLWRPSEIREYIVLPPARPQVASECIEVTVEVEGSAVVVSALKEDGLILVKGAVAGGEDPGFIIPISPNRPRAVPPGEYVLTCNSPELLSANGGATARQWTITQANAKYTLELKVEMCRVTVLPLLNGLEYTGPLNLAVSSDRRIVRSFPKGRVGAIHLWIPQELIQSTEFCGYIEGIGEARAMCTRVMDAAQHGEAILRFSID